ncbi:hypothetical protein M436DRAFT_19503, partial [Aureobasidium namibiae CBS 147.97]
MDYGHERLISHGPPLRRHPTWRLVVIINTMFVGLVLLVYIVLLIWIYNNLHVRHGVAEVFSGTCPQGSRTAAYTHFATNAFAVLLFAVGTHASQILLSPTRAEVENAHARDRWLHIGVGGLRNMKWIHKRRLIKAVVLLATSILLTLLHNSMIFTTLATTDTAAALVTEDYLTGSRLDGATEQSIFQAKAKHCRNISKSSQAALTTIDFEILLQQMRVNLTDLKRLSPEECRSAYSSLEVPSRFSNVLLVTSSNASNTLDGFVDGDLLYPELAVESESEGTQSMRIINWFDGDGITPVFHNHCVGTVFDFGNGDTWNIPVWDYYCTVMSYPISYCLAQRFEFDCGVALNTRVFTGIIVCLIVQVGCLTSLVFSRGFLPLATVGDAVASFLRHPESLVPRSVQLSIPAVHSPTSTFDKFGFRRSEKDIAIWKHKWPVWRAAVDTEACALFINILFLGFFAIASAVLIIYNNGVLSDYQSLTLHTPTSTHGLLANLFSLGTIHLPISVTYLFYNHLWSRMLVASELNQFSKTPATLRVTIPTQGALNTSYLAVKPHFIAILLAALTFCHFLTTQAFNVVAIQNYDVLGHYSHQRIIYGISTSSAILALALGFVMLCVSAFAMERKLDAS